jgi:hypothetical protein
LKALPGVPCGSHNPSVENLLQVLQKEPPRGENRGALAARDLFSCNIFATNDHSLIFPEAPVNQSDLNGRISPASGEYQT